MPAFPSGRDADQMVLPGNTACCALILASVRALTPPPGLDHRVAEAAAGGAAGRAAGDSHSHCSRAFTEPHLLDVSKCLRYHLHSLVFDLVHRHHAPNCLIVSIIPPHRVTPTTSHNPCQGRCHVALIASSSDLSSLQSACEDYVSLHKLGRSDVHVHTLILADPAAPSRREDMREISRALQQIERQEPRSVTSDKDMSAMFYSVLHGAISSLLQASSLDWFVASPSAPGMQPQYAPGRGVDTSDGSAGGGNTTRRSEAGGADNAPSWLTMDGQVCRCRPTPVRGPLF